MQRIRRCAQQPTENGGTHIVIIIVKERDIAPFVIKKILATKLSKKNCDCFLTNLGM